MTDEVVAKFDSWAGGWQDAPGMLVSEFDQALSCVMLYADGAPLVPKRKYTQKSLLDASAQERGHMEPRGIATNKANVEKDPKEVEAGSRCSGEVPTAKRRKVRLPPPPPRAVAARSLSVVSMCR